MARLSRFTALAAAAAAAVLPLSGCGGSDSTPGPKSCVAGMDAAWAVYSDGADPTDYYGAYGLTFDNADGYGLIGGMGNGDPGNWDIDGTNGTAAWGLWPGTHGVLFDASVTNVSLDFLRGFDDLTLLVDAYLGVEYKGSWTITLSGAFDFDTARFAGPIDQVTWTHAGYFGVDNLRYERASGTCPP